MTDGVNYTFDALKLHSFGAYRSSLNFQFQIRSFDLYVLTSRIDRFKLPVIRAITLHKQIERGHVRFCVSDLCDCGAPYPICHHYSDTST